MRPPRFLRLLPLALATTVVAVACGDDEDTLGPGDLAITVSPTSLTLDAGTSEDVQVNVVRSGSFSGNVSLSADGLPAGVTAQTTTVLPAEGSGDLTFVADETAEAATATVTIRATGTGVSEATTQLTLTVVEGEPSGSFSFAFAADSVTLQRGVPDTLVIPITREGTFTGPVSFAAVGMPSGLTALFEADTVAGDTARVTLTADTTVAGDSVYVLTFTGSAEGVADFADTLYASVEDAGSSTGFSFAAEADSVFLLPGGADTVSVILEREDDFTGAVAMVIAGAPDGLTVTLDADTVAGDTATIVFAADSTLADSVYVLTVTGSAEGQEDFADTISIAVSATNAFRVGFDPDSLTIGVGSSDSTTVRIMRAGGFIDSLTFVADSLPTGITATLAGDTMAAGDSLTMGGDSVWVVISVDSTATADTTYALVMHASSGSFAATTDTLWVTVPGSSGAPSGLDLVSLPAAFLPGGETDTPRAARLVARPAHEPARARTRAWAINSN